jgi:hypothetical protein
LKRVFITTVLLLGSLFASSAFAAYTEVWNPPEAQSMKKNKARSVTPAAAKKKRKNATSVKQIADKAAADSGIAPRVKAVQSQSQLPTPKQAEPVIPRKIEPNGQVMRV